MAARSTATAPEKAPTLGASFCWIPPRHGCNYRENALDQNDTVMLFDVSYPEVEAGSNEDTLYRVSLDSPGGGA